MFLVSAPDQYLFNPAFQIKMLMIVLAGCNMLLFYRTAIADVRLVSPGAIPLVNARLMGMYLTDLLVSGNNLRSPDYLLPTPLPLVLLVLIA